MGFSLGLKRLIVLLLPVDRVINPQKTDDEQTHSESQRAHRGLAVHPYVSRQDDRDQVHGGNAMTESSLKERFAQDLVLLKPSASIGTLSAGDRKLTRCSTARHRIQVCARGERDQ